MSTLAQDLEPDVPQEEIAAAEAATPEEAPQAAETPEAPKEEVKADEPKEEKLVRLEALHEERGKRKQVQRELEQMKQNQAVLADRLNQIYQAQQPQPQIPDASQDPLANHDARLAQQEQRAQWLIDQEQRRNHDAQQANLKQQVVGWYSAQAAEFAKETPDFGGAYQHIKQLRAAELQAMGYNAMEAKQALENDEMSVVARAYQSGENPAAVIYRMAQATGYKKSAPAGQEKMKTLQKGVEASKTLGVGGAAAGNPTPEQIANMSDAEFAELKAKLGKKGQRLSDVI